MIAKWFRQRFARPIVRAICDSLNERDAVWEIVEEDVGINIGHKSGCFRLRVWSNGSVWIMRNDGERVISTNMLEEHMLRKAVRSWLNEFPRYNINTWLDMSESVLG